MDRTPQLRNCEHEHVADMERASALRASSLSYERARSGSIGSIPAFRRARIELREQDRHAYIPSRSVPQSLVQRPRIELRQHNGHASIYLNYDRNTISTAEEDPQIESDTPITLEKRALQPPLTSTEVLQQAIKKADSQSQRGGLEEVEYPQFVDPKMLVMHPGRGFDQHFYMPSDGEESDDGLNEAGVEAFEGDLAGENFDLDVTSDLSTFMKFGSSPGKEQRSSSTGASSVSPQERDKG